MLGKREVLRTDEPRTSLSKGTARASRSGRRPYWQGPILLRILCQHATSIGGTLAIGGATLALGNHACESELALGLLPQYKCVMEIYVLPVSDTHVVRSRRRPTTGPCGYQTVCDMLSPTVSFDELHPLIGSWRPCVQTYRDETCRVP